MHANRFLEKQIFALTDFDGDTIASSLGYVHELYYKTLYRCILTLFIYLFIYLIFAYCLASTVSLRFRVMYMDIIHKMYIINNAVNFLTENYGIKTKLF
jgi:hypothetical protein